MNKMYEYLKNHAYISRNKQSNYQFELSEERAKCIANKHNSLIKDLKQENKQLKNNWNKLKEIMEEETREYWDTNILEIMQKIERSDSDE